MHLVEWAIFSSNLSQNLGYMSYSFYNGRIWYLIPLLNAHSFSSALLVRPKVSAWAPNPINLQSQGSKVLNELDPNPWWPCLRGITAYIFCFSFLVTLWLIRQEQIIFKTKELVHKGQAYAIWFPYMRSRTKVPLLLFKYVCKFAL